MALLGIFEGKTGCKVSNINLIMLNKDHRFESSLIEVKVEVKL